MARVNYEKSMDDDEGDFNQDILVSSNYFFVRKVQMIYRDLLKFHS